MDSTTSPHSPRIHDGTDWATSPIFSSSRFVATHYHMSSATTVESLDLGEALVHKEEALATYRRLAEDAGLSERSATLLVNNMGYRTLEDLENVAEARRIPTTNAYNHSLSTSVRGVTDP